MLAGLLARLRAAVGFGLAAEAGRLAPWLAVALGAGVAAYFALPFEPDPRWRWAALPPLLLAGALAARAPLAAWLVGLPAAAALGAAAASWHAGWAPPMFELPRGAVVVGGTVSRVELLPEGRRVTLEAPRLDRGDPLARRLRVRLRTGDPAAPRPGDVLTVRALVRPPASPAYPGAWDFQRAAWFSGLAGSGFAIGPAEVAARAAGDDAAAPPFAGLRSTIEARVGAALPGATGAIAAALLTGGQSAIPAADLAALRDSGLAHILSVSGLHIAIVMGVSFAVVRLLLVAWPWLALRLPVKACAAVAALAAGGFYLLLTGGQVPMLRSFAMAALATLALLSGRRALTLRAWAFAAAAILLLDPASLLGPSFQMSFAAVLALIAGWDWLRPRVALLAPEGGWRRRLALGLFGVVATSLLAGFATTPFGLHHFGRLQLYGVAANAVAVPLTSVLVMPAGMAAAALMPFGLERLALVPMGWGVEGILIVARWVASWPGAAVSARPIPSWGVALAAFGLIWLSLWRARWRLLGLPLLAGGLLSGTAARPPDLLVSADARLIALRTADGAVHLQRLPGASNLTRDSWLRLLAVEGDGHALPRGPASLVDGAIACTPGACRFRPSSAERAPAEHATAERPAVAVLLRGDGPREACETAAVVVSAEPVRGRCGARVVDRFAVWRNGSHAIWLSAVGGSRVLSDREVRGARPWVPPVPRPRSAAVTPQEPPAATE